MKANARKACSAQHKNKCLNALEQQIPSHQLAWKCKTARSKRKAVFLQGSVHFHVSWWEGTCFLGCSDVASLASASRSTRGRLWCCMKSRPSSASDMQKNKLRVPSPFLPAGNHQQPRRNRRFLKRTMVEKNGEPTPRNKLNHSVCSFLLWGPAVMLHEVSRYL